MWRRRRYRVRRGDIPGTFYFTVSDNGVTSNEFWRILDCDEGLEWCLMYYSGAAATAGVNQAAGRYPPTTRLLDLDRLHVEQAGQGYATQQFCYFCLDDMCAGLSYSGAVLATRNGLMPTEVPRAMERIETALEAAGIKM